MIRNIQIINARKEKITRIWFFMVVFSNLRKNTENFMKKRFTWGNRFLIRKISIVVTRLDKNTEMYM